jgi:hypothetical protein
MIVYTEKKKLYFNDLHLDDNNSFKYNEETIDMDSFHNFLLNSLYSDELSLVDMSEDTYYDIIRENFDYMEYSINPLIRKDIALKLAKLLINIKWIRKSIFVKNKIYSHKNNDKYITYFKVIINYLVDEKEYNNNNKLVKNNKNLYFSYNDFLYDYF